MELELLESEQPQPIVPSRWKKFKAWLTGRYAIRNARDQFVARVASGSLAVFASLAMLAAVLGMPTGFGTGIDVFVFLTLNIIAMIASAKLLSFLYSMLYLPLPRRLLAAWTYASVETFLILYYAEFGIIMSVVISLAFTFTGMFAGVLMGYLLRMKIKPLSKAAFGLIFAFAAAAAYVGLDWPGPSAVPHREVAQPISMEGTGGKLDLPNPSEPGGLAYQTFTYGSGNDKHRAIFGDKVGIPSTAVDASAYISKWSNLKTKFWGFDEHALPLNGRVWMPEGEGPFPLALIVHGNHLMEDFSDGGYGYIGELLASKGIITVSVDENFLNYSVWSGIPNNDMKVRAWLLLKHLQQIKQLNEEEGNFFTGHVDLERVALIGHSRGGQAAAMAADADRWFKEDQTLDSLNGILIESVVAIAPTDKQVDDKSARLSDVNYLTLQGARDADVNNFYGDRQYSRTTFAEQSNKFKAALYIADANHSQFNSEWGRMDERPPGGLFLNRKELLKADEQRQISKVYVSAFLQETLLGQEGFRPLFEDYRLGLDWLPETVYTNRFEASEFTEIARFDDGKRKTVLKDGGKAGVSGMSEWEITSAEDRDGKIKGTKGIELEWEKPGAEYALELSPTTSLKVPDLIESKLVFSLANLERDLISADEDKAALDFDGEDETELPPLPAIEITVTTAGGESSELALADIMPVSPPAYTAFMTISWLEKRMKEEKYKESTEPVFQTFTVPIEQFIPDDSSIESQQIRKITFRFTNGPGKVMLDDIGLMQ
ncbi:alpha/beta hydrolase [Paenibacillus sp. LHD-38]|uniref:alpha/beta hydrolase n=1 Tax=Paenibacillus sp. LHD-38 TaxID=3072143 RepID=UPI00280E11EF|nr:alpha/beta hydrolase [Paenibacillus sp. LHD-38]MDQ8736683.1 alpha/beta hydrolase [Paenibacillus sp. LHD-38]